MKKMKKILTRIINWFRNLFRRKTAEPASEADTPETDVLEVTASKTAVHWYLPTMSAQEAEGLKGYHIVIVDPENIFNNRESLEKLRQDNPNVKIYCYFNAVEWFFPMWDDKPWSINIAALLNQHEEWFMHGKDGKRLTFWVDETGRKMQTMNCRIDCPKLSVYDKVEKLSYIEFITERFIDDILKSYQFDGVLMDNLWDKINWLGNYGVNQSGIDYGSIADGDSTTLNLQWKAGMDYCLDKIKQHLDSQGAPGKIIGNPGHLSYPQCSGKMYEYFPEIYLNEQDAKYEAWYENLTYASAWTGPCIFNARADNYFFSLCSAALLDNVYFSYMQNTTYDEKYNLNLGKPLLGVAKNNSRPYENGTVFVDPGLKRAWIVYKNGERQVE